MFHYRNDPLAPARSVKRQVEYSDLVDVVQLKVHLGLHSGSGGPMVDTALDDMLEDNVAWATQRVSEWEGRSIVPVGITDYYSGISSGSRLALSESERDTEIPPAVNYIAKDADLFTPLPDPLWKIDETVSPEQVVLSRNPLPQTSDEYLYPLQIEYQTSPYTLERKDLIAGTLIQLVALRYSSRGQMGAAIPDSAIRRIIVANLGT